MGLNEIDYNCCKKRDIQFRWASTHCKPDSTEKITTSTYVCTGCWKVFKVRGGIDKPPPQIIRLKGVLPTNQVGEQS